MFSFQYGGWGGMLSPTTAFETNLYFENIDSHLTTVLVKTDKSSEREKATLQDLALSNTNGIGYNRPI